MKIKFMKNQSTFIYNLKNILFSIFILLISENCLSQTGWIQQFSGTTANLHSIKLANSNTGWCVGNNGVILKTTNGGINWFLQQSGVKNNLYSLSLPSVNNGYAVGDSGLILKTTNGGYDWLNLNTSISNSLKSVFFVNENIGFTGGYFGEFVLNLYKTTNGGNSWNSIQIDASYINSIYFLNPELGWATIGVSNVISGASVIKTSNGGLNWIYQFSSGVSPPAKDVFFIDSLYGWLSYRSIVSIPTILRTTDGGNNWITEFPGTGVSINSLYFTDRRNGWGAGDNSVIQATTNGGINWINQTSFQLGKNYNSVYFTDSLTGWVVCDSGIILKTTTGGVLTNFSNISSEIPEKFSLLQNYPNPFNPRTIINYQLTMFNFVSLKVYDVLGNEVAALVNENQNAGAYSVEFDGSGFSSGVYLYRLEANGNHIDTKRMIFLK